MSPALSRIAVAKGFALLLAIPAPAVVPEHAVVEETVRIAGVGPDNPILYDNDWWFDVFDNDYLWAQASLGKADLRGNIVSRDMWDWQKGYLYKMEISNASAASPSIPTPPKCWIVSKRRWMKNLRRRGFPEVD